MPIHQRPRAQIRGNQPELLLTLPQLKALIKRIFGQRRQSVGVGAHLLQNLIDIHTSQANG